MQVSGQVYDYILWGRFINGVGCGVATTVGPMMLTEISPVVYRGIFGTCNQFGVVIGMLLAWVVGLPQLAISSSSLDPNAFVLGLPLLFGVIQLLVLPWCPDSPAYLTTEDMDRAKEAAQFYGMEEPKMASASQALPMCKTLIVSEKYSISVFSRSIVLQTYDCRCNDDALTAAKWNQRNFLLLD